MKFKVCLFQNPCGRYTARVPCLNGVISEGDDVKDALANITEALELYLEVTLEEMDQDDSIVFPRLPEDFALGETEEEKDFSEAVLYNFKQLANIVATQRQRPAQPPDIDDLGSYRKIGVLKEVNVLA